MTHLIGHDEPIAEFLAAARGERMHHAWLFSGPKGLGKASLAHQLALRVLADAYDGKVNAEGLAVSVDHQVSQLFTAGSHPDFRLLKRLPKDEKLAAKPTSEWPENVEFARSISVDQVRRLNLSFATFPSLSNRRVVIIDAIDDMERGAANALLKTLEEPPSGTVFLLISHAAGRLLPTIRSRCCLLRFSPLDDDAMTSFVAHNMPEVVGSARELIVAASKGLPGAAVKAASLDMASVEDALVKLCTLGDVHNTLRNTLSKSLSAKAAQTRYEAFLMRAPQFIASVARGRQGDALADALAVWDEAKDLAQNAVQASLDPQTVVFALASYVAALAPQGSSAKA